MVLKLSKEEDKFVEDLFEKCMIELGEFFEIKWTKNRPGVIIINDRKTFDEFKGEKTEDWNVGFAANNKVYLLNRRNFEKDSSHKYSDEEYICLLKHELTHLYYFIFSKGAHYPRWFEEGLAVFVSGQTKNKKINKFKIFLDYFEKRGDHLYSEGGYAVKLLFENFGKEKLFELIKNISSLQSEEKFNLKFKEIYGEIPSYKFFNRLLKDQ